MTTLKTTDDRYIVVRGRLWRATNPELPASDREYWTKQLMAARREVRDAKQTDDSRALKAARASVDEAKRALGERGEVWWTDGAPDYNRCLVANTPYAAWYQQLPASDGNQSGG
ncbi:hypothetical protein EB809_16135 [Marinobacter sp. R17]|uniref:hypothetical protein n=1 Tax=Marinobacter sp. R17 TaxID=2484250 RepID=UPI000F4BB846|nr:hypothetical protein [Marinobacter sp. R17]ROT97612.1 hypothetical protein EB809_16135 [Marinobacter sp. R17]